MSEVIERFPDIGAVLGDPAISQGSVAKATTRSSGREQFVPDEELVGLVHQVFLRQREPPVHTVVFAGMDRGNGCSRVSAGTASLLAKNGGPVCLVEANIRTPSLSGLFGERSGAGLVEALTSREPVRSFLRPVEDQLWLLPAGSVPAGFSLLIAQEWLKRRLEELREIFAYIIVDAPSVTSLETSLLGRMSSGVVLVLEAERTRRDSAAAAANQLRSSEVEILGAVLNKRTYPIPQKLYAKL
jgi:Mrp family chromosome partitioning ATPase